jgi:hypothetical protein
MIDLINSAERVKRAAIRELPDGVYKFLRHVDDDGIDVGRPIPLQVTIDLGILRLCSGCQEAGILLAWCCAISI